MSIIDNAEDLTAAEERLAAMTDEQLVTDLAYWAATTQDHLEEHDAVRVRLVAVKTQYAEAQTWVTLTTTEIRRRRDAKRAKADG